MGSSTPLPRPERSGVPERSEAPLPSAGGGVPQSEMTAQKMAAQHAALHKMVVR